MPVNIDEYVTIVNENGVEQTGLAKDSKLVKIASNDGSVNYGRLVKVDRVQTTIVCDNEKCEKSTIDENFKSKPFTWTFDDNGDGSTEFMMKINGIVIASNYRGEKMCFCSPACSASYFKRVSRENLVPTSFGKGQRTILDELAQKESEEGLYEDHV